MSDLHSIQKSTDIVLDAYDHVVKLFEQLQLTVQSGKLISDGTLIASLINESSEILGQLLNFELSLPLHQTTDLDQTIRSSLIMMENYLSRLKIKVQNKPNLPAIAHHSPKNSNDAPNKTSTFLTTTPRIKGLHEIAGLVEVKEILSTIVLLPLQQPQLYSGTKFCNSVLLFGPPGTGKTQIVHAIAAEASAKFFSINSSDILSKYVGATERAISELFRTVKAEDDCTVLFFDEIDGLCQHRHSDENSCSRRIKTELMTQLSNFEDHPNKFLICATNCPWDLDSAILRRFQRRIFVPLPNKQERLELLKLLTKGTTLENCHLWESVLEQTEGFSGSDLTDLLRNAKNRPIMELLNTCLWQRTSDDKLVPLENLHNNENVIHSKLSEIPFGCAQARPLEVLDVIVELQTIKPTVPLEEISKYEKFV